MKLRKYSFLGLILLFISACGGEDDNSFNEVPDPIEKTDPFDKIAALAVQATQIFQMDVNLKSETINETNLTKDYGVEMPYKIFTSNTHASFLYRRGGQIYSFKTKAFDDKSVEEHDIICGFESGSTEAALGSVIVKDYLLIFTGSGNSYDELSVRSKHIGTGNCQKISFGEGYDYNFDKILYEENQLIVSFTNRSGQYSISYIDLLSGEATTTTFERYYSATFQDGMLHILFYGDSTLYQVYDPKDWSLIESKEFASYLNFGTNGLVETQMYQSEVLIDFQYAQPAPLGNGPRVLNLNTGEYGLGSQVLSTIKSDLNKKYNENINIISYKSDLESKTLVIAYEVGFGENSTGGLLKSNFEGLLIKDLSLPYAPYAFEFVD